MSPVRFRPEPVLNPPLSASIIEVVQERDNLKEKKRDQRIVDEAEECNEG